MATPHTLDARCRSVAFILELGRMLAWKVHKTCFFSSGLGVRVCIVGDRALGRRPGEEVAFDRP